MNDVTALSRPTRTPALIGALSLAAGCYGAAPPRPPAIPLPDLTRGGEIAVASEETTRIENVRKKDVTCPQGHTTDSPDCVVTHRVEAEPVTRVHTTATYAGERLSYAQLKVMTDPERDAKLARLDRLRTRCGDARVPRNIGLGLMLGSLGALVFAGWKPAAIASVSAFGAGSVSFGVGYFAMGGRQCNQAVDLYRELDLSADTDLFEVEGAYYAEEMKKLADQFNAGRVRAEQAATAAEE